MSENVIHLGAEERANAEREAYIASLFGPERCGSDLIVDGRAVPNIAIHDFGHEIEFVLDGRMAFAFPRELAGQAAAFAANAMAVGAGYACLASESRERPFAPRVSKVDLGQD